MEKAKTLKSARSILSKHESDMSIGNALVPQDMTVTQWIDYCIEHIMQPNLQPTTLYGYQGIVRRYINPNLGKLKIQSIKPYTIQTYYSKMMNENKLSPNTVIKHHDLLKVLFKYAVNHELLLNSPIDRVEPPKKIKREARVYNIEQLQKLMQLAADTRMEIIIKLCAYLGLRREEACGLTWSDIDFESRTMYIRSARTTAGAQTIVKETKNYSSTRTLHIAESLYNALQKEKDRHEENLAFLKTDYIQSDFVLVMDSGKPYRPNYVSELFTHFIAKHNLPKIVLHELRHTFASLSNYAGVQEFNIGKALGHSTPSTTKKIYTHLFDVKQTEALNAVADMIDDTD